MRARLTIVQKMALVLLLPSLGDLGVAAYLTSYFVATQGHGRFVSAASRQHLLLGQIQVYAHMVRDGQEEDRAYPSSTISEFEHGLRALEHAGTVPQGTLPPAPAAGKN
jgi:hypothetical protein